MQSDDRMMAPRSVVDRNEGLVPDGAAAPDQDDGCHYHAPHVPTHDGAEY